MSRPKYKIGDKLRRQSDGRVCTVKYIGSEAYHFTDGTIGMIADEDRYTLAEKPSGFFRVATDADNAPLGDYLSHGYESRHDFRLALQRLCERWGGREGERCYEQHNFLLLRFYDVPGGGSEAAWLPYYLLTPCPVPDYLQKDEKQEEINRLLDEAFGFD